MSKYCLTFSGEISKNFKLNEVKSNFKKQFKLSEVQSEYIFSGKHITLKKELTQQEVLLFATLIDKIGGISYIEPMAEKNVLPSEISRDRRFNQRRLKIYGRRRLTRGGHLTNRRKKNERRVIQ
ncbi:MAG: hypothetical protein KZQ70_04340 [gamma proteobacterium symbiont of Lucinoma myriamae]|nr:hypothetical protein [gamma proteobacterium symbiont of Lucinoma myriamae]MCU7818695.1 hypothetical protein [gamma proteobacterium symbiont of Lucinoma myriamae]MCU7831808.1 hypothetical protein [gamma proteobacterium symbiont of Lucinoma myriamae]